MRPVVLYCRGTTLFLPDDALSFPPWVQILCYQALSCNLRFRSDLPSTVALFSVYSSHYGFFQKSNQISFVILFHIHVLFQRGYFNQPLLVCFSWHIHKGTTIDFKSNLPQGSLLQRIIVLPSISLDYYTHNFPSPEKSTLVILA